MRRSMPQTPRDLPSSGKPTQMSVLGTKSAIQPMFLRLKVSPTTEMVSIFWPPTGQTLAYSAVFSGDDGDKSEFYEKIIFKKHQFSIFTLTYPKADKARYKPIIEHIVGCFYPGVVDY